MATVNYSVPDDVRTAFNKTFAGQNKSAVIADLMREAVERRERLEARQAAMRRIVARRRTKGAVTAQAIRRARETGRA